MIVRLDKNFAEYEDCPCASSAGKRFAKPPSKHREWEALLSAWYKVAKYAQWEHFGEIRQTWKSADRVGSCVLFDIANNRCRLIAWINYEREKLFIRHILDHAEYGRAKWKNDCNP